MANTWTNNALENPVNSSPFNSLLKSSIWANKGEFSADEISSINFSQPNDLGLKFIGCERKPWISSPEANIQHSRTWTNSYTSLDPPKFPNANSSSVQPLSIINRHPSSSDKSIFDCTSDKVFRNTWSANSCKPQSPVNSSELRWGLPENSNSLKQIYGDKNLLAASTETLSNNKASPLPKGISFLPGGQEQQQQRNGRAETDEDIIFKRINSHEGWGTRPVNQMTPWNLPEQGSDRETSVSTAFLVHNESHNHPESNVWASEPPNGTSIWEAYYEQLGEKTARWQHNYNNSCPTPADSLTNAFNNPTKAPDEWKGLSPMWNDCLVPTSEAWRQPRLCEAQDPQKGSLPRPRALLGGGFSRCSDASQGSLEESPWARCFPPTGGTSPPNGLHQAWPASGRLMPDLNDISNQLPHTENAEATGHLKGRDFDSNVGVAVHPFSHTYRADLVKFFMGFGYRREDVQTVLIDCNMDLEHALQHLQQYYIPVRPSLHFPLNSSLLALPRPENDLQEPRPLHSQAPQVLFERYSQEESLQQAASYSDQQGFPGTRFGQQRFFRPTHQAGAGLNNVSGPPNSRISAFHNGYLGMHGFTNHQPTPQARATASARAAISQSSAANLQPGGCRPGDGTFGGSLLGLPPAGLIEALTNSPLPAQALRPFKSQSPTGGHTAASIRSHRQFSIISAVQELQKKKQGILNQIQVYRNNLSLCSQPQCAVAIFNELQNQLQQIDFQLKSKETQLNLLRNWETDLAVAEPLEDPLMGLRQRTAQNQDSLAQKLMHLRLRAPNTGASTSYIHQSPSAQSANFTLPGYPSEYR